MPFTLTMPKLSPTMSEGTITRWLKVEGEFVEAGEPLIEVATDKATVEYNALDSGWLRKIIAVAGQEAVVNERIAIFSEEENEEIDALLNEPESPLAPPKEALIEAPPEKMEVTPPLKAAPAALMPQFRPEPLPPKQPQAASWDSMRLFASPLARRLAKERQLDLHSVKGSGPSGRIVAKDLEKAAPLAPFNLKSSQTCPIDPGTYEEEPLTPIRKVIGQRLRDSKASIPHFNVSLTIDAEALMQLREQLKNWEIKVTFNDLIIKAVALALKQHPDVNSGFNSADQTLIRFKTVDISVAVSIEGGLITPIVRTADYRSLSEIAVEVKQLVKKAKEGKLEPHEYKGGSFTISNLGMYGVDSFQAIINPPQGAILAVAGIKESAVVKGGQVQVGHTLTLTLSCDHRIIDGSVAAQFLLTLRKLLENPAVLAM